MRTGKKGNGISLKYCLIAAAAGLCLIPITASAEVYTEALARAPSGATATERHDGSGAPSVASVFDADGAARSYADLTRGSLGIANEWGYSSAALADELFFSIGGAGADTVTPLKILFHVDGSAASAGNGSPPGVGATFSLDVRDPTVSSDTRFGSYRFDTFKILGNPSQTNLQYTGSWMVTPLVIRDLAGAPGAESWTSDYTVELLWALRGANPTMKLSMFLGGGSAPGGYTAFGNTGKISFILPQDVTFTSASGVFLTTTAVPEPATWAMMIIGFGAAGSMIRRRKSALA